MRSHQAADSARAHSLYRLAVLVVPIGLGLVAAALSMLVGHMAVHLCGWPATISCDFGVPVVWTALRGGLWAAAVVATADAVAFVRNPDGGAASRLGLWALWGPLVVVTTWKTMRDRSLEMPDLVFGAALVGAALILIGCTVAARLPLRKTMVGFVVFGPAIAVMLTPWWGPAVFRAAEHPSAERVEQHRRRVLEQCLREQERVKREDPTAPLSLCESFPISDDAPLPPAP